jgi:hypothetical protein
MTIGNDEMLSRKWVLRSSFGEISATNADCKTEFQKTARQSTIAAPH